MWMIHSWLCAHRVHRGLIGRFKMLEKRMTDVFISAAQPKATLRSRRTAARLALFVCAFSSAFAETWHFRTLAGSTTGGGYADGPAALARFSSPSAVTACNGSVYIADAGN